MSETPPPTTENTSLDCERRKNSGALMNGEAIREIKQEFSLALSTMRKDFWRACALGLLAVFGAGGAIIYDQARTDENQRVRIEIGEKDRTRIERDIERIEDRLAKPMVGVSDFDMHKDEVK